MIHFQVKQQRQISDWLKVISSKSKKVLKILNKRAIGVEDGEYDLCVRISDACTEDERIVYEDC